MPTPDRERQALEAALGAQYEIVRPLGRGGMGSVYLARERLLERLVAIKVLHRERVDTESHERFVREARAAARLTHPNIVPLYSFGQSEDTLYYVMGYVEGESLESLVRRTPRLPVAEVTRILSELADALDYAHRHGVVHRDVKPDNIMIEQGTGRAVLTDFGIARVTTGSALTRTGVIIGTPQYMSPEQAAGDRDVDGRGDLYSLGLVGYRMLTGRLPFDGTSVQDLLAQHLTKRPLPLASLAADAPMGITAAIMRCLEKDPDDRFASGAALRVSLSEDQSNPLSLPDGLEHHASRGVHVVAATFGTAVAFELVYVLTRDPWWLQFGGVASALVLTAITPSLVEAKRAGLTLRQSMGAFFAKPAKWTWWWPRKLRRPGDVWDRLPEELRLSRNTMGIASAAIIGALPLYLPVLAWGARSPTPHVLGPLWDIAIAGILFGLGATGYGAGRAQRWANRHRLPRLIKRRLLAEPTWGSTFWSRPEIAPYLASALSEARTSAPATPDAFAAAIGDLAANLEPFDSALAVEVRASAGELVQVITGFDREIAEIAAHLDPAESERVEERLRALGEGNDNEADATRRMRHVLAEQLALISDLRQRHGMLVERRGNAIERLRTLWMHLAGLRARRLMQDADAAEITGRIRALCSNVAQLNSAIDQLDALTPH